MKQKTILLITVTIILGACGTKGASESADSADSTDVAQQPVLTALPDTSYSTTSNVKYDVDVYLPDVNPTIDNLADMYADAPGAFTFRKGPRRDADFGGRVSGTPTDIEVDWRFTTSSSKEWGGGSGWTGQPLYVEWPDSCVKRFKAAGCVLPDFSPREIIVGSLAAKVYFIDYDTGKASRQPIDVTNPIKGTVSLDPTFNGNLYVGQGVPENRPIGAMVIDLYSHRVSHFWGEDPKAPRHWGAYDSSPVRVGQFLFRPGENGVLYKYIARPGSLELHSTLRYRVDGAGPGMESSMSVYLNYGYTTDNHGNILCVNLNTMRPVWHYRLGDDTDATPVLIVEEGVPYIYTGCEIDRQGTGTANFVKLNGLNGQQVWLTKIEGRQAKDGDKHFDGGFYATALPGRGDCEGLIFTNCVLNTDGRRNGIFVAFNRADGSIVYKTPLKYYAWSSPVGFLNDSGKQYIFTGDCSGRVYLINGADGSIIADKLIGNNFESSPVVVGNHLVVGTRGNEIIKMTIK